MSRVALITTSFRLLLAAAVVALVLLPGTGSASAPGRAVDHVTTREGATDALVGDVDGDGVLDDDDNCPDWSNAAQGLPKYPLAGDDFDCDGFSAELEAHVGTDPTKHCNDNGGFNNEPDFWPTDFNDSRLTDLSDVVSMGPTFNKLSNQQGYNQRYDLDASNGVTLADVILIGPFWLKNCLEPPASSEFLIAQALAAGDITYEDSLRYRAYAIYQTPDLPVQFNSPLINYHAATELLADVLENQATLSPQLLADLEPFMARPADPVSIFNNPPAASGAVSAAAVPDPWVNLAAASGNVRVWARASDAGILPDRMGTVNTVWPHLQAIFPFSNPDTPGSPSVNPDSAIDIYFADPGEIDPRDADCNAVPVPAECTFDGRGYASYDLPNNDPAWGSFIVMDTSETGTELTSTIAHELAHVGQHSYDVYEPMWLKDATAQWAAERVLMRLNQPTAPVLERLLKGFFRTLDRRLTRDPQDEDDHRYASWLFFFHASMDQGDGIVTTIWQNAAAPGKQGQDAVDAVYPFIDNFDDFATHNWNQPPVEKVFPLYKGPVPASPLFQAPLKPNLTKTENFTTNQEEILTNQVIRLSAKYFRYTFANNVRKVTFENYIVPQPDAHIWAIPKIGGQWKTPEDWSRDDKKRFCRDFPDEDLQEVIIIVSNSSKDVTMPAGDKLKTKADTESCKGFIGTATATYHQLNSQGEYAEDWTVTANILWEEDEDYFFGCGCRPFFPTGEIDWEWSFSYPEPPCNDTDSGNLDAGQGVTKPEQMLILWEDGADMTQWFYSATGLVPGTWYSDCELGDRCCLTFIDIPAPDVIPVTPTLPPTMPPPPPAPLMALTPVAVPVPGGEMSAATTTGFCPESEFSFPRDQNTFSGSCYAGYHAEPNDFLRYDWNFTRIGGVP